MCIAPYYVRHDLKSKVVPWLGELHVAMVALKAICVSMALYELALDGFFKDDSQLKDACLETAEE